MSATVFWLCLICAICVCLVSLVSSHLFRKEPNITTELMSMVSFVPGFAVAAAILPFVSVRFESPLLATLMVKNILYGLAFYYRYESLRKFGPFIGALMLGTQPIVIFVLALGMLGEGLPPMQILGVALAAGALLILARGSNGDGAIRISWPDFTLYYALPTLVAALAVVWDRYLLKGRLTGMEFFALDRLTLLPALLIALALIRGRDFPRVFRSGFDRALLARNWIPLAAVAVLVTGSVFPYNLALEMEKAAIVGLFRNAAYPLAAFLGAFLFSHRVTGREWLSLIMVVAAMFFSTL